MKPSESSIPQCLPLVHQADDAEVGKAGEGYLPVRKVFWDHTGCLATLLKQAVAISPITLTLARCLTCHR